MTRVAFMHIEKTGGCTIRALFQQQLKPWTLCPYLFQVSANRLGELSGYDLIAAHMPYDQIVHSAPEILMTFVREPRSRMLSAYFFRLPYLHVSAPRVPSLVEFARSFRSEGQLASRRIWGNKATEADFGRLASFDLIGITECFNESVQVLADMLQTPLVPGWENATRHGLDFELGGSVDELVSLLDESTALDRMIYDWAVEHRHPDISEPPPPDQTLEMAMKKLHIS